MIALEASTNVNPSAEELIARLSRFEIRQPTPKPSSLLPPERIQAVKELVLENIMELCYEFCPNGRLSPNEGYWEVPHPDLIKISLSTGNFFNLENRKLRKPLGDIFGLWTFLTGEKSFRKVVIELEHWCKKVEGRRTQWKRNDGFDDREVKEGVFVFLLNKGEKPVIRGTGRGLCLLLQKAYQDSGGGLKELPIEFQKPTLFLRTLKKWATTGDGEFFTVTMKSRKDAIEFILTVFVQKRLSSF
jgi:hypothetical protein